MPSVNREVCPHCHQTINEREVVLNKHMVSALKAVYDHCIATGRHEFRRREIDPFIPKGTAYANFGYWKWLGNGMVYSPPGKKKGYWGFNLERVEKFFGGEWQVVTKAWKSPMKDGITPIMVAYIEGIPDLKTFLDENEEFIAKYRKPKEAQMSIPETKVEAPKLPHEHTYGSWNVIKELSKETRYMRFCKVCWHKEYKSERTDL